MGEHLVGGLVLAHPVNFGGSLDVVVFGTGLAQCLVEHLDLTGDEPEHHVVDRCGIGIVASSWLCQPLRLVDFQFVFSLTGPRAYASSADRSTVLLERRSHMSFTLHSSLSLVGIGPCVEMANTLIVRKVMIDAATPRSRRESQRTV